MKGIAARKDVYGVTNSADTLFWAAIKKAVYIWVLMTSTL